jgi:acyl carrier protein
METEEIQTDVRRFIRTNFIFSLDAALQDDQSLLGTGIIDSTGVLELIAYLEKQYQVSFEDNELIAENFDTVQAITRFLETKRAKH